MSMHTPSIELLRALRSIANTSIRQGHRCPCRLTTRARVPISMLSTSSYRTYATRQPPNPYAPTHRERGPKSTEDTQTDFGAMDVFGHIPAPATSIDATTSDGFHLDNGVKTAGGSGVLLVGGEAFLWEPWRALPPPKSQGDDMGGGGLGGMLPQASLSDLLDARKGILTIPKETLGLLELVHPKPDLLFVGTGAKLWMLNHDTRRYITEVLGCRLDVMDTHNAAAAYNLLAKERGIEGGGGVGALLLPGGWTGPKPLGNRR